MIAPEIQAHPCQRLRPLPRVRDGLLSGIVARPRRPHVWWKWVRAHLAVIHGTEPVLNRHRLIRRTHTCMRRDVRRWCGIEKRSSTRFNLLDSRRRLAVIPVEPVYRNGTTEVPAVPRVRRV